MGTPHEPKWGNGGPMSHLGSPRSETRYHLLCSIIFGAQCSQVTGWEWTLTPKTVVAIGPPTGHELRYGTRSDIHLQKYFWVDDFPHFLFGGICIRSLENWHTTPSNHLRFHRVTTTWAVRTGAIKEAIGLNVALRVNRETRLCLPQR